MQGVEVKTRNKRTYFPQQINIRLAPLQEALIEYCSKKKPGQFRDKSDFIRIAVTQYSKTVLEQQEFEHVCRLASEHLAQPLRTVQ